MESRCPDIGTAPTQAPQHDQPFAPFIYNKRFMDDTKNNHSDEHTLVLMSGGIDSSAAASQYITEGCDVSGVFVDYGQPAAESEWVAVRQIADHLGVDLRRIELGCELVSTRGEIFGRNAIFALIAASTTDHRPLNVAMGIHALSEYYDTTLLFMQHIQRIMDGYSGGGVRVEAPFVTYTKAEVIEIARNNGLPFELTYSCERRSAPQCGDCGSCGDRIANNVD